MDKIIIAIDGFSSCGKSTLAKQLASKIGYVYIDSGAMYRAVTLYCLRNNIIHDDQFDTEHVINALENITIAFEFNPSLGASDTYLNGENVEREIREMEVSTFVSKISEIKEVRKRMVSLQRKLAKNKGIVMDGRDIGTNVFPDAELKIFMTADVDIRAKRRMDELSAKGYHVTFEEVKANLHQRDMDDTTRKESPLVKADKAYVLDNSDITREEQLNFILKLMRDLMLVKDQPTHSS